MSKLPVVAIIGRPNTGKSTLFNRLIRRRVAIESPIAGTTRDHIARKVTTPEVDYLLLDTGGMGGGTDDKDFENDVHKQSALALAGADLILFTVDGRSELTKSDDQIVTMLRKNRKRHVPVILVITKCDTDAVADDASHAFHKLGIANDILTVSAAHNLGTEELQEIIVKHLKKLHFGKQMENGKWKMENQDSENENEDLETGNPQPETEELEGGFDGSSLAVTLGVPRVAIVGRPNVGKSSLVNALMSDPQKKLSPKLVSDIPGTTRDATDTIIRHEEQEFIFVDTAGLRRKSRIEEDLEGLSVLRTIQTIEQCDVAVLLINADEPVSKQDKTIAGLVTERGKGLIIVINKIDKLKGSERDEKMLETRNAFLFCRYAPILPASAVTRENLVKLFPQILMVTRNMTRRIAPRDLITFIKDAVHGHPMSSLKSCKHAIQTKDPMPTFVLFVRNPKAVEISQMRYLENRLRERFGLEGVPVKWITKGPRDRN